MAEPDYNKLLDQFQLQNPTHEYKFNGKFIFRKTGNRWRRICELHGRVLEKCTSCEGSAMCIHKKERYHCIECNGTKLCEHDLKRKICKICRTYIYCQHDKVKTKCKDCNGKHTCIHKNYIYNCIICTPSNGCVVCHINRKVNGDFCIRCTPGYIEKGVGCSKIACQYIDDFEKYLKCDIVHMHYDYEHEKIVGMEHCPQMWSKKPVDGYYIDNQGNNIAIEFLGNYYHGHPNLWKNDENAINHHGKSFKFLFYDTERKLQKLKDLGYIVYYVWESDFKFFKDVEFVTFIFDDKLEWRD